MVRIGIICPSRFEYAAIRNLPIQTQARVHVSGMGKVRSACAVYDLHRTHPSVRRVLLIGFAGGLSGLRVGEVIEPKILIEQDYCAEPFEKFPNQIRLTGRRLIVGSKDAALLTQDRFLTANPYAGSSLAKRHPRLACDMEAYAVARAAASLRLPCSVVKLISDEADAAADHDFLKSCRELKPKLRSTLLQALQHLA